MSEIFNLLRKNNYWNKREKFDFGFPRDFYLDKLEKYLGNNLIKVLIGQRRSGKSYIMRQMISRLIKKKVNPKNIFYFNKELIEFDEIDSHKKLYNLIKLYLKEVKPKGKIYLFLDEIQEIDKWEKLVNSFSQNYKKPYEVFLTGSNSNMLSGEIATYLSGRYITFEILPFSFDEYVKYFKIEKNKNSFWQYLKTGGLPELFHLPGEEERRHYVSSLKDTIILKDIMRRYNIKDIVLLESIFKFLCNNIGHLTSINKIVGYLNSRRHKTNVETVSNYIKYLTQAYLIHEVERYDIRGKEILDRGKKYYLNDLAFASYLSSSFDFGPGKQLENIVYLHYRRLGFKIYVGKIYNNEIDFIIENNMEKKYVQVAYLLADKKTIEREYGSLEKISDNYKKMVISADDIQYKNKNGIEHLLVWDIFTAQF